MSDPLGWSTADPADLVAAAVPGVALAHWLRRVRPPWMVQAACRRPEHTDVEFYATRGRARAAALEVCDRCPVQSSCLAWALDVEQDGQRFGIAGGLTPADRCALSRRTRGDTSDSDRRGSIAPPAAALATGGGGRVMPVAPDLRNTRRQTQMTNTALDDPDDDDGVRRLLVALFAPDDGSDDQQYPHPLLGAYMPNEGSGPPAKR